jgi:hypothetical protein
MRTISLSDFLTRRDARAKQLGIIFTQKLNDTLRNKGSRRTAEKRAALRRIEERCAEAGVEPLKAHY